MDKQIYELQQKIIEDIKESKLPLGVVYYIVKDILLEVDLGYNQSLKNNQKQETDE